MPRTVWRFLGSVNLTIWLLLAISLRLAVGSRYVKYLPKIYDQLNFLRFQEWSPHWGAAASWWVWTLFALLFLFAVNTAVCTGERMLFLLKKRGEYQPQAFVVAISPSIMHVCFLVIIGGHAISQFAADTRQLRVGQGARISLSPDSVTVLGYSNRYRNEPEFAGLLDGSAAILSLAAQGRVETREVGILTPVYWEGRSIHLLISGRTKAGEQPNLKLVIKRDPGLSMIIIGNVALCILMIWYFPIIIKNRNGA